MPPSPRPDPGKISKMAAITLPDAALNGTPSTNFGFCARTARKQGFQTTKAHKNLDFVLEMPENKGFEGQKRTKTSILCSKCPKTRVSEGKSAQKPRFCARKARKRGFRRPKKHKNLDFVLGKDRDWHREERKLASGSSTVAFLLITAHVSKTQMPHIQIINF